MNALPALESAIVELIQKFQYEDLDAPARAGLSRLMRDQIALQIGTSTFTWSKQVLAYAQSQCRPGQSRVVASAHRWSALDAAFVNGSYGHGFEYDDAHGPSASHPGSCVIPAALAIGEELGSSMKEVLTAIATGYEVYTRIGMLAAPDLLHRGFHPHGFLSNFGAAAVAAKLRGLDAPTTWHALAIAMSHAGSTTEYTSTGGSIKRVHAGIGTRNGMMAADMARFGLTGPLAFLSGRKGFFRTFLQRDVPAQSTATFALSPPFQLADVWLKAYCACYCTHAYIDALRPFAPMLSRIEGIEARISPAFNVVVGTANIHAYRPENIEHVQFSLPIQMAFTLLDIGNGYTVHRDYLASRLDMQPVMALAARIQIVEAPELQTCYPGQFVADVRIRFSDGSVQSAFVDAPIGTTTHPMPEDEQDAKFMALTSDVLGQDRANGLLIALRQADLSGSARALMDQTVPEVSTAVRRLDTPQGAI